MKKICIVLCSFSIFFMVYMTNFYSTTKSQNINLDNENIVDDYSVIEKEPIKKEEVIPETKVEEIAHVKKEEVQMFATYNSPIKPILTELNGETGTPEDFGAIVNDGEDDTVAIQKAINSYSNIYFDSGTYDISDSLIINGNKNIKGKSDTVIIQHNNKYAIRVKPIISGEYTGIITDNSFKADNILVNIEKGDIIKLKSDVLWNWDNRGKLYKGELKKINNWSENQIYFSEEIFDNYSDKITATIYKPITLYLSNINFRNDSIMDNIMIWIDGVSNSVIENISIYGSKKIGIHIRNSYNNILSNNKIDLQTTKDIATGYGIQDYSSTFNEICNNNISNTRRGVDVSGDIPSYYSYVKSNKAYGLDKTILATGSSGYGTHSTAVGTIFKDNYSEGFQYGYVIRSKNVLVENNKAVEYNDAFVSIGCGDNIIVQNNNINKNIKEYILHNKQEIGKIYFNN